MYFGYLQGRSEKDPSTNWYEGELWFFDFYVLPLARKLKECGVFGVSSEEYLDYAVRNRSEWARKGKEVAKTMLEGARIEAHEKGLKRMDSVDEDDEESSDSECSVSSDEMSVAVEAASTKPASAWIVLAPPGKLGIIIDTTLEGPVVHRVSVGSVMKLKLASGDVIMAIDGVKTLGLSAEAISALTTSRAEERKTRGA
jgi:hypothetical protein